MTFALRAGRHALNGGSPLLKAYDAQSFSDAAALLVEAQAIRDRALADAEVARAEAVAEGRAAGLGEVRDRHAEALAVLADGIGEELVGRRADIAAAAYAGARAIVGSLDEAEVTARMASRAVDKIAKNEEIVIAVAPGMAAAVRDRMSMRAGVSVREDPGAAPLDCVLHTGDGRIIASLSLQLDALAARWGVAP